MIKTIKVDKQFIESQDEFLKDIQLIFKNALMRPLIITTGLDPQVVTRTKMIIEDLGEKFGDDLHLINVIPGALIEMLFPKKELIISAVFMMDPQTKEHKINLGLVRLAYE